MLICPALLHSKQNATKYFRQLNSWEQYSKEYTTLTLPFKMHCVIMVQNIGINLVDSKNSFAMKGLLKALKQIVGKFFIR